MKDNIDKLMAWIKTASKDELQAFVNDLWEDTRDTGKATHIIEALVQDYKLDWPWIEEMERKNAF